MKNARKIALIAAGAVAGTGLAAYCAAVELFTAQALNRRQPGTRLREAREALRLRLENAGNGVAGPAAGNGGDGLNAGDREGEAAETVRGMEADGAGEAPFDLPATRNAGGAAERGDAPEPEAELAHGSEGEGAGIFGSDLDSEEVQAAAQRLRQSPSERVTVTAADGTRLAGHWREQPGARRVILAMHGWRGSWYRDFALVSSFWEAQGCSVLYAEQRGQGESGGAHLGFGARERYDCLTWIDWINARTGAALPLYLAGISMGATTVLLCAGLEVPDNVRGIMADCGFTSPEAIWKHVLEHDYHLPYGLFRRAVTRRTAPLLGCRPDACSTVEALRESALPVLLVHGLADDFVPPEMSRENFAASAASHKRLLLVPGAKHGMSYAVDRKGYEEQVLSFWAELERPEGERPEGECPEGERPEGNCQNGDFPKEAGDAQDTGPEP